MTAFEELSKAAADVLTAAGPSVVSVSGAGSGFVLSSGYVVTNAHNLRSRQSDLLVSFADGRAAAATIAGVDFDGDLAILSLDTGDVPALPWAGDPPSLGQVVVGLSRPNRPAIAAGTRGAAGRSGVGSERAASGEGVQAVTNLRAGIGFVTGLGAAFRGPGGRTVSGAIEHSAPLAHGSSGGPVVDAGGRLVAINTHRVGDGFYLALPASVELKNRLEALTRGEEPRRVRLGVALAPSHVARRLRRAVGLPEREGVLVHAVEPGGVAERAGIRRGDLIVSVAAGSSRDSSPSPVTTIDDLAAALETLEPPTPDGGVTAELGVVRGTEETAVSVDFSRVGPTEEGSA